MTGFVVFAVFVGLIIVASLIYTAIFGSVTDRVAKEIGLEESDSLTATGRWNGRDVSLGVWSTGRNPSGWNIGAGSWSVGKNRSGYVAHVEIAASVPCHFRACHMSRTRLFVGGPPAAESPSIPDDLEVWCDAAEFVQQLFSNSELRERMQIALRTPWDLVEMNHARVRVEADVSRFDSDYSALFAAWNSAKTLVAGLGVGIPEGGALPMVEFTSQ